MKLPSYLVLSRHGVFYFRLTYLIGTIRKEKRWSLHTRCPAEAKRLSVKICATFGGNSMINSIRALVGHAAGGAGLTISEPPGESTRMAKRKDTPIEIGLTTTIQSRNGSKIILEVDQSDPKDVAAAKELTKTFIQENAKTPENWDWFDKAYPQQGGIVQGVIAADTNKGGASIEDLIDRYQIRQKERLSKKTMYEYGQLQRKFAAWLKKGKGKGTVALNRVGRQEIAGFIDVVNKDGTSLQTIQRKYLAALSGLFEFAQTIGEYPQGDLPTKNHKLYTHQDQKRSKLKSGWKRFSNEDLSLIFNPENFLALNKPCDYWLPLLGLFTGARISELCQLKPDNIRQIDGIWAIDINEEDEDQSVKTPAGIRIIPMHQQLIDLGFLDYVEDVRQYGGTIFPYMTPDKFNHYSRTPGRRFGEYLNRLGITDQKKVFHSFRSTANNELKQNTVQIEDRCQFIGHEYKIVNSQNYSDIFRLRYLRDHVLIHLKYEHHDFSHLHYPKDKMKEKLDHLMKKAISDREHEKARALRGG